MIRASVFLGRRGRIAALAATPMAAAALGAWMDERLRLGFTTWRTACRAAGFSPGSVIEFTLQLLPNAVTGLLLGSLALVIWGLADPRHGRGADCLAAHAGCALSLPLSLLLCATAVPPAVMLPLDLAAAIFLAGALERLGSRGSALHP